MTEEHAAYIFTQSSTRLPKVGESFSRMDFPHVICQPKHLSLEIDRQLSFSVVARVTSTDNPLLSKTAVCTVSELYPAWNVVSLHEFVLECMQPLRPVWRWYLTGDPRLDKWLDTLEGCYRNGWRDKDTVPALQNEIQRARLHDVYASVYVVTNLVKMVQDVSDAIFLGYRDPAVLRRIATTVASHAADYRGSSFSKSDVFEEVFNKTAADCSTLAAAHLRRHR